jgi:hypothetical protein
MIELQQETLNFRFPEVHKDANCGVAFQRTLRIPDDNRTYPLPAGLGNFPIHHVDDFAETVPSSWAKHGGVFLPMYQSEAMWINFQGGHYPFAIKIAAGKINAVSGEAWEEGLNASPQDYVVTPGQPWLDGFSVQKELIRQFVAMPLGEGYTAEEQLTGEAEFGGLQIIAYPMRKERYELLPKDLGMDWGEDMLCLGVADGAEPLEMGLAPGGLMHQQIYEDQYGIDAWDTSASSRCFIHIVNSAVYRAVTGCQPPTQPVTAEDYKRRNIPWFDYYGGDAKALEGAPKLSELDSVATKKIKKGHAVSEPVIAIDKSNIKVIKKQGIVREGLF